VGVRLVERSKAGVAAPTAAGEVLLRHAEEILAQLRVARADVRGEVPPTGALGFCVATSPGPAAVIAAELVTRVGSVPNVRPTWKEVAGSAELIAAVAAGDAAVGVGEASELDHPLLRAVAVVRVPLRFVWDRRASSIGRFHLELLDGRPLTGYRTCSATRTALASLHLHGIRPAPLILSDDGVVISRLVSEGSVALVPDKTIPASSPRLAAVSGFAPAELTVVRHRERRTAQAYRQALCNGGGQRALPTLARPELVSTASPADRDDGSAARAASRNGDLEPLTRLEAASHS
jgi:DNA-binding transcriptional LysR family regulator